jgi:hypothetical protein
MENLNLNLNKYINPDTSILYNDINANKIVIFSKPIIVSSSFSKFYDLPNFIFSLFNNNYSIVKTAQINNPITIPEASSSVNIMEGFDPIDNSDIYIDCKPTGVSTDEISTYNLPINSSLINDVNSNKISQTITAFCLFMFFLIIASIVSPLFYHNFIWASINKYEVNDKYTTLKAIDILLIVFFLILSIFFIVSGFSTNNIQISYIGIIFLIVLFSSYSVISLYKLNDGEPPKYTFNKIETAENTVQLLFRLIGIFFIMFFTGIYDLSGGKITSTAFFSFYVIICFILFVLIFYYTTQLSLIIFIILWFLIGLISLYLIVNKHTVVAPDTT